MVKVEVKGKGNSKSFSIETNTLGGRNLLNCQPPLYYCNTFWAYTKKVLEGSGEYP